jgi:3-oxoadipate enol-lactonase
MTRPPGREIWHPIHLLTALVEPSLFASGQGSGREGLALPQLAPEALRQRMAAAMFPYAASTPVAVATELGIRTEAALRALYGRAGTIPRILRPPSHSRGHKTTDRHLRIVAEGDRSHDDARAATPKQRPVVHWHDGGHGPALLLLNGWSASGLVWPESWLAHLEEHHRVIRIDNRGSGWSRSAPHPFTIADMADDARDVLQACQIDRAVVVGLSMGGMIAQELAMRHGGLVDRLVLAATRPPAPAYIAPRADMFRIMLSQPPQNMSLPEFFSATWAQTAGDGFASDDPAVMAEIAGQLTQRITPRSGVFNQARAIVAWHGAERLRRISAPTTVVHGERDPLIPAENGKRLAKLIPHAAYAPLPGIGHLVAHEAGDALLEVLGK